MELCFQLRLKESGKSTVPISAVGLVVTAWGSMVTVLLGGGIVVAGRKHQPFRPCGASSGSSTVCVAALQPSNVRCRPSAALPFPPCLRRRARSPPSTVLAPRCLRAVPAPCCDCEKGFPAGVLPGQNWSFTWPGLPPLLKFLSCLQTSQFNVSNESVFSIS